jgi:heme exporter protein A
VIPPSPLPTLLSARGLACERGERWLFDRLDVALRPGELLWVRGRNGRGKTSLLRLLAGVALPAAGDVQRAAGAALAYVGHADALKDELRVAEALAFLLRIQGHPGDRRSVEGALAHWGLFERRDAPVRMLSPGLRRRVALARLSVSPRAAVWILDEPFDALDADGAERLDALLARHLAAGGGVLITGHALRLSAGIAVRELDLDARPLHAETPSGQSHEGDALVLRAAGRKLQLHGS